MIIRLAEQCYWMFRYLERTESLLYKISAFHFFHLDNPSPTIEELLPLFLFPNERERFLSGNEVKRKSSEKLQEYIFCGDGNLNSLKSLIKRIRENGQQLRELIPDPFWQNINELYWWVEGEKAARCFSQRRAHFFEQLIDRCHLIKGGFFVSMLRDGYFHLMELGMVQERAAQTAYFLESISIDWFRCHSDLPPAVPAERKFEFFSFLLKCSNSLRSFLRFSPNFDAISFSRFFLSNIRSPYSFSFCLAEGQRDLHFLYDGHSIKSSALIEMGRLRAQCEGLAAKDDEQSFDREYAACLREKRLSSSMLKIGELLQSELFDSDQVV